MAFIKILMCLKIFDKIAVSYNQNLYKNKCTKKYKDNLY